MNNSPSIHNKVFFQFKILILNENSAWNCLQNQIAWFRFNLNFSIKSEIIYEKISFEINMQITGRAASTFFQPFCGLSLLKNSDNFSLLNHEPRCGEITQTKTSAKLCKDLSRQTTDCLEWILCRFLLDENVDKTTSEIDFVID